MSSSSAPRGATTSEPEVTNISTHGFWILLDERELFLPFDDFPWFRDASVRQIVTVERPGPEHLYWPELDVDLNVHSIEDPRAYPLVAKTTGSRVADEPDE